MVLVLVFEIRDRKIVVKTELVEGNKKKLAALLKIRCFLSPNFESEVSVFRLIDEVYFISRTKTTYY